MDRIPRAGGRGRRVAGCLSVDRETFSACPANSMDYAVMEKLGTLSCPSIQGAIVPLNAGWSDVGAWDAVWKINKKDEKRT